MNSSTRMQKSAYLIITILTLSLVLWLSGCESSISPTKPDGKRPSTNNSNLGLVEITISGIATNKMSANARSTLPKRIGASSDFSPPKNQDNSGDGTIEWEVASKGSFTYGKRGSGGVRYLYATFKIRNAQFDGTPYDEPLHNLTLMAVSTGKTLGDIPSNHWNCLMAPHRITPKRLPNILSRQERSI